MPDSVLCRFRVVFEAMDEGGFLVSVPDLPGCLTSGDTMEEARRNAREAVECYVSEAIEAGDELPEWVQVKEGRSVEDFDYTLSLAV